MIAYTVRVFCRQGQGGNLAGVVLLNEPLSSEQMQDVAARLNFSETIFLSQESNGHYKALYFTPNSPIDFCGHASLAAFGVLQQLKGMREGVYQLETLVGLCEVTVTGSLIYLSQPLPRFEETISEEEVAAVLGISPEEIRMTGLNPKIVSTGLRDIMVPVRSCKCLFAIQPDYDRMIQLSEKYDVVGLHVFSLDSYPIHCRNFAPRYGIPEESATGSSNGALGCYLFKKSVFPPIAEKRWLFKQGDNLQAPSDIHIRLMIEEEKIMKVECGGEVIIEEQKELER